MYKNNLWRAILQLFGSNSFLFFLINLDRLGNAICGGDYRFTISGRVGYFALIRQSRFWLVLQWVIDTTFYPIDKRGHCFKAYKIEKGKKYRRGNDLALFLLSVFVVIGCLLLVLPVFIYSLYLKW